MSMNNRLSVALEDFKKEVIKAAKGKWNRKYDKNNHRIYTVADTRVFVVARDTDGNDYDAILPDSDVWAVYRWDARDADTHFLKSSGGRGIWRNIYIICAGGKQCDCAKDSRRRTEATSACDTRCHCNRDVYVWATRSDYLGADSGLH